MAVRHAEKTRSHSTCPFADRVCLTVLQKFRELQSRQGCQQSLLRLSKQTVLAGFVFFDEARDEMECVSLGVGTKFREFTQPKNSLNKAAGNSFCCRPADGNFNSNASLMSMTTVADVRDFQGESVAEHHSCLGSATSVHEEKSGGMMTVGEGLTDMHAEVLAKKGLMLYLAAKYRTLHERVNVQVGKACLVNESAVSKKSNKEDNLAPEKHVSPVNRLQEHRSLHMYTSSAPCGDACVRRWGKGGLGQAFPELPNDQWPASLTQSRPKFTLFGKKEGHGAFLEKSTTKREEGEGSEKVESEKHMSETGGIPLRISGEAKKNEDVQDIPLRACTEFDKRVSPLSCSDKILLWQNVGFQGSCLSGLIDFDSDANGNSKHCLHCASITVGRKFTECHMNRAVWERYPKTPPLVCMTTMIKFDETVFEMDNRTGVSSHKEEESSSNVSPMEALPQIAVPLSDGVVRSSGDVTSVVSTETVLLCSHAPACNDDWCESKTGSGAGLSANLVEVFGIAALPSEALPKNSVLLSNRSANYSAVKASAVRESTETGVLLPSFLGNRKESESNQASSIGESATKTREKAKKTEEQSTLKKQADFSSPYCFWWCNIQSNWQAAETTSSPVHTEPPAIPTCISEPRQVFQEVVPLATSSTSEPMERNSAADDLFSGPNWELLDGRTGLTVDGQLSRLRPAFLEGVLEGREDIRAESDAREYSGSSAASWSPIQQQHRELYWNKKCEVYRFFQKLAATAQTKKN